MANKNIKLKIYYDFLNIKEIKNEWKELYKKSKNTAIYSEYSFFIKHFQVRSAGKKPYIIFIEENENPIFIGIFNTSQEKIKLNIGYLKINSPKLRKIETEIGGLLYNSDYPKVEKIIKIIFEKLKRDFDLIEIPHLPIDHPFCNLICREKKLIKTDSVEWSAAIADENNKKAIYNKPKTLSGFRRFDKKLINYFDNKYEIIKYNDKESVEDFIKYAEIITKKSYQNSLGVGVVQNKYWSDLILNFSKEKIFYGYILWGNSKPIAYQFGFVLENTFFLIATTFDSNYSKISPGGFLMRKVIDDLVKDGIVNYHFGYGDADYKKLYGNKKINEINLKVFSNSTKGLSTFILTKITSSIHEVSSYFLVKFGLMNKIKKIWRSKIS